MAWRFFSCCLRSGEQRLPKHGQFTLWGQNLGNQVDWAGQGIGRVPCQKGDHGHLPMHSLAAPVKEKKRSNESTAGAPGAIVRQSPTQENTRDACTCAVLRARNFKPPLKSSWDVDFFCSVREAAFLQGMHVACTLLDMLPT